MTGRRAVLLPLVIAGLVLGAAGARSARGEDAPPGATPFELTLTPAKGEPRRVTAWEREGSVYVSAGDMALVIGATKYWRSELGRVTLVKERHEAAMMDGSSLAQIDGSDILHLSGAAFLWDGRMWLPLDLLLDDAGEPRPWADAPVRFSRKERTLGTGGKAPALVEASLKRDLTGWHLILTTPTAVRAVRERTDRSRFVLRLPGVQYDPLLYPLPSEHAGFQDLVLRNLSGGLEVSFTPAPQAKGYRVSDVRPHGVEILLGTDERDLRSGEIQPFDSERRVQRRFVRRILLQPGRDEGGAEGDVTTEICRRAQSLLQRNLRLEVKLVGAGEGEAEPGDLFLAIHVHSRPGGPAGFVEVGEGGRGTGSEPVLEGLGFVPTGGAQESLVRSSRLLAQSVVDATAAQLDQEPRSITAIRAPELSGLPVPAALLEFGGRASKWNDDSRDRAAAGIAEGIRLYLEATGEGP